MSSGGVKLAGLQTIVIIKIFFTFLSPGISLRGDIAPLENESVGELVQKDGSQTLLRSC